MGKVLEHRSKTLAHDPETGAKVSLACVLIRYIQYYVQKNTSTIVYLNFIFFSGTEGVQAFLTPSV